MACPSVNASVRVAAEGKRTSHHPSEGTIVETDPVSGLPAMERCTRLCRQERSAAILYCRVYRTDVLWTVGQWLDNLSSIAAHSLCRSTALTATNSTTLLLVSETGQRSSIPPKESGTVCLRSYLIRCRLWPEVLHRETFTKEGE